MRPHSGVYYNYMIKKVPKVEAYETRKDWEIATLQEVAKQLSQLNPSQIHALLTLALSDSERSLFIRRIAGIDRLQSNKSYKEIGRELWLSPQTVSSLKKALAGKQYVSNWPRAKEQQRARERTKWRTEERPMPARYKNTKYGKLRMH